MPFQTINGRNVPIQLWAPLEEVDSKVIAQLKNVAALPWVAHHVAVMPDVHLGKGATVGSVIAMRGAVAPAAVGVDIGCGMAAVQDQPARPSDLPDDLRTLRAAIEHAIPVGRWRTTARPGSARADDLRATRPGADGRLRRAAAPRRGSTRDGRLPARHAGRRQPLHRGLPRRRRTRLADAALGQPRNIGKALAEHHIEIARSA